jgi:hypothetical protein
MPYTAPNPDFYLQWHDEGQALGAWNGAASAGFDPSHPLGDWILPPGASDYTFHFSTRQGNGHPYTVFATIADPRAGRVYGAKFAVATAADCYLSNFTPEGSLTLAAGSLTSGDPKIQIRESPKQPPTCTMIWDGRAWAVAVGSGPPQPYTGEPVHLSPDDNGECTVNLTDQTASERAPSICAVYYKDQRNAPGINVGMVQSQTQISSSRPTPITIRRPTEADDPWQCTLELFAERPSNHGELLLA